MAAALLIGEESRRCGMKLTGWGWAASHICAASTISTVGCIVVAI